MTEQERNLIKGLTEELERAPWLQAPYYKTANPTIRNECVEIEDKNRKRRQILEMAKKYLNDTR
jgi:hypothetical protein